MLGDDAEGYRCVAWIGELPLGAYLCRSWWDIAVEGKPGPSGAYKDVNAARAARKPNPQRRSEDS
jgi:hypothetical protein